MEQSCANDRIEGGNPVPSRIDGGQSCAQRRIEWGNPVPNAGLMAKRVMVKKHSVSDVARTASLTDLRRWPSDGFFGQNTEVGIPTSVGEQSRNSDLV